MIVTFLVFLSIFSVLVYFLWEYEILQQYPVPYVIAGVVLLMLLYIFSFIYFYISRPIKSVLGQMNKVLTKKPFKKIYTARVDEIGLLAHFFNKVTEGFTQAASKIKERKRILDELAVAVELQSQLFPQEAPEIPGLTVSIQNRPASELGGDSFDIVDTKDKVYMYVGDVTGHGVTAGMIMAMVNAMIKSLIDVCASAKEVLVLTNKNIKSFVQPSMYMTLVLLCWDKAKKKMTYVGAGHERILVYRKAKSVVEEIVSGGVALGLTEDASGSLSEKEIPELAEGDMVILYSDGITEAKNSEDKLFGLDRLKAAVVEYTERYSAKGVGHHIAQDLAAFVGDESQLDDMTLIVIEKTK